MKNAQKKVKVCVVIANGLGSANYLLKQLKISSIRVLNNGAQIFDPTTKKLFQSGKKD